MCIQDLLPFFLIFWFFDVRPSKVTKKPSFHLRLSGLNPDVAAFHDLAIADVQLQEEEWNQLHFMFHRQEATFVPFTKTNSNRKPETVVFIPHAYQSLSSLDSFFFAFFFGGGFDETTRGVGWNVGGTGICAWSFSVFPFFLVMFRWMFLDSMNCAQLLGLSFVHHVFCDAPSGKPPGFKHKPVLFFFCIPPLLLRVRLCYAL